MRIAPRRVLSLPLLLGAASGFLVFLPFCVFWQWLWWDETPDYRGWRYECSVLKEIVCSWWTTGKLW